MEDPAPYSKKQLGQQLAIEGMNAAADHADRVTSNWSAIAYHFLIEFSKTTEFFLTEDVRQSAFEVVPAPPDRRAWGAIIHQAVKSGLIVRHKYANRTAPQAHRALCTQWKSLLYKP